MPCAYKPISIRLRARHPKDKSRRRINERPDRPGLPDVSKSHRSAGRGIPVRLKLIQQYVDRHGPPDEISL